MVVMNVKRKLQEEEAGGTSLSPAAASASSGQAKRCRQLDVTCRNSVLVLNQLRPDVQYRLLEQQGPAHSPTFVVSAELDGCEHVGTAASKRLAKLIAAQMALRSLVQCKDMPLLQAATGYSPALTPVTDFTSDEPCPPASSPPLPPQQQQQQKRQKSSLSAVEASSSRPSGRSFGQKNALQLLHELRSGLVFVLEQESGHSHSKQFTMSVTIDSRRFCGTGSSKRAAKCIAARDALRHLYNYTFVDNMPRVAVAGACDTAIDTDPITPIATATVQTAPTMSQTVVDEIGRLVVERFDALMESRPSHNRRKVLAGVVMSRTCSHCHGDVTASSATATATSSSDGVSGGGCSCVDGRQMAVVALGTGTKCIKGECMSEWGLAVNDCHAEVVTRRSLLLFLYDQLALLTPQPPRQQQPDKCGSNGSHSADDGGSVADSTGGHTAPTAAGDVGDTAKAPGVCSTGDSIQPDSCIFEPRPDAGGYRLKQGVQFHLYISTAPCGDARIFSPHEDHLVVGDKHPNRRARGQLRAKIEAGEGTVPMKGGYDIQTWDGVLQGVRLLTMSCSDKLARWCTLGLQGALLSLLIEPVYLSSVTLGSLFHESHLGRAVSGRIGHTLRPLPPLFALHVPQLNAISRPEPRQPGKASNYSINWTLGQCVPEVVSAITGKNELGQSSRLCKRQLAARFLRVAPHLSSLSQPAASHAQLNYSQIKHTNKAYMKALQMFKDAFQAADLGKWMKKPLEQDLFCPSVDELLVASVQEKGVPQQPPTPLLPG